MLTCSHKERLTSEVNLMLKVKEGGAEEVSRKDILQYKIGACSSLVGEKVEGGAPDIFGRLLEAGPPMLLLMFCEQNLFTWTHLLARRLGNVFFILGGCVPCYNLGILLLWKRMALCQKRLLIKAVEIKNSMSLYTGEGCSKLWLM